MEKLKEYLLTALVIFLAIKLASCSFGTNEEAKLEARIDQELYEYEIYQEGIDQGRHEVEGYLESMKSAMPRDEFIHLERLIEVIYEEYGEWEANRIIEKVINHPDNIVICPADIVDSLIKDYYDK